jgi:rfaE bifunctional protein kinase chain/domain
MNRERVSELMSNFSKQVLVVGDVMLDRFVYGDVDRFSPEAPSCRVLSFANEATMLGGAGNSARNLGTLGAKCVRLTGVIGHDDGGRDIKRLLNADTGAIDNVLVHSPTRATTLKTRFVSQADGVHLLRSDRETIRPLDDAEQSNLFHAINQWSSVVAGIVVADYGKGVVTPSLLRLVSSIGLERNIPIFIDPKKTHWEHFKGVELVKPNLEEAYNALGLREGTCSVDELGERLLKFTRAKAVIITRGSDGMSLFTEDEMVWSSPAPTKVIDVSGAGDTAMSALALARMAGATWAEAMELANMAAGIAVGKSGTATVSAEEILNKYGEQYA